MSVAEPTRTGVAKALVVAVTTLAVVFLVAYLVYSHPRTSSEDKQARALINEYFKAYRAMEPGRLRRVLAEPPPGSDAAIVSQLRSRRQSEGRIRTWRVRQLDVDSVNRQIMADVEVKTTSQVALLKLDIRASDGGYKIYFINVVDRVRLEEVGKRPFLNLPSHSFNR